MRGIVISSKLSKVLTMFILVIVLFSCNMLEKENIHEILIPNNSLECIDGKLISYISFDRHKNLKIGVILQNDSLVLTRGKSKEERINTISLPGNVIDYIIFSDNTAMKTTSSVPTVSILDEYYIVLICDKENTNHLVVLSKIENIESKQGLSGLVTHLEVPITGSNLVYIQRSSRVDNPIVYIQQNDNKTILGFDMLTGNKKDHYVFMNNIKFKNNYNDKLQAYNGSSMIEFQGADILSKDWVKNYFYPKNVNLNSVIIDSTLSCSYLTTKTGYYDGNNVFLGNNIKPTIENIELVDNPINWVIYSTDKGLFWFNELNPSEQWIQLNDFQFHTFCYILPYSMEFNDGLFFVYSKKDEIYVIYCIYIIPSDLKYHQITPDTRWDIYWCELGILHEKPINASWHFNNRDSDTNPDTIISLNTKDTIYHASLKDIIDNMKLIKTIRLDKDIQ